MDDGERIRLIFIKITENVDCQFEIILVNLFSLKESCENCWGTYILAHREFLYRMMYKTSKNNFLFEVCFVWILEDKETHLNWWLQKILPNMLSSFYCNFSFNGILSCHSFVKKIPQYDSIMISHCSRINTATDWANISRSSTLRYQLHLLYACPSILDDYFYSVHHCGMKKWLLDSQIFLLVDYAMCENQCWDRFKFLIVLTKWMCIVHSLISLLIRYHLKNIIFDYCGDFIPL